MNSSSRNSLNLRVRRKPYPAVEVRDTAQYGRGVFALENVSKGCVIHVLDGYMKTLFGKPRWRDEIPKFEMEALNAMIKISDED